MKAEGALFDLLDDVSHAPGRVDAQNQVNGIGDSLSSHGLNPHKGGGGTCWRTVVSECQCGSINSCNGSEIRLSTKKRLAAALKPRYPPFMPPENPELPDEIRILLDQAQQSSETVRELAF